jgi:hypothetical protein
MTPRDEISREVVIGRNSRVWRSAESNPRIAQRFRTAIGHSDLANFAFERTDRVWVFSYSRIAAENRAMLARLQAAQVASVVYVSSATTIVSAHTDCYEYPRIKRLAETDARRMVDARVLVLGIVVDREEQLPSGRSAATLQRKIDDFLLAPHWPDDGGTRIRLFEMIDRPFTRAWEHVAHRMYDSLQWTLRRWPCALRPIDVVLRACGVRWYGYVNLSNRLWNTTT